MSISYVSKTPTSILLPDGSRCSLINDNVNGYTVSYYLDNEKSELYTKLDMSEFTSHRCLLYQIYQDKFSYNPDVVTAVPYISDDENMKDNSLVSQPLFECISPMLTYVDEHSSANLLFWTNLSSGKTFEKNDKGQLVYDAESILKINPNDINNFSFQSGQVTRALCSATIEFKYLYMFGEIADNKTENTLEPQKMLVPIAKDIVVLKQVKADSPVLDFNTFGGGSSSLSRHAHTNNSDAGFSFAVFHPGTGVPLGNPWKN